MFINNRCEWKEWFQVRNEQLKSEIGVSNDHTFYEYRKELINAGLVEYRKGKKGQPPFYRLVLLYNEDDTAELMLNTDIQNSIDDDVNNNSNEVTNSVPNSDPNNKESLIHARKLNKTKRDETKLSVVSDDTTAGSERLNYQEIKDFWNENCRNMKPIKEITDKRKRLLRKLVNNHGQTQETILATLERACNSNFMNGEGDRKWIGSFNWIIEKVDNYMNVAEGKYDNRFSSNQQQNQMMTTDDYILAVATKQIDVNGVPIDEYSGIEPDFSITQDLLP